MIQVTPDICISPPSIWGEQHSNFAGVTLIATVVIVELGAQPKAEFVARYGESSPSHATQNQLDRLSPDFANVEERAKQVADKAVQRSDLFIKRAQQRAAIIGGIVTALLTVFTLFWTSQSKVELLNQSQANLEKRIDDKLASDKRISQLEHQVEQLQTQFAAKQRAQERK